MEQIVTITPKWQIHIPVAFRKKLKLTKPIQMIASVKGNSLMVKKKKSILDYAGTIKPTKKSKKINLDEIRDYIDYSNI